MTLVFLEESVRSVFKSEFSSSFENLKGSINIRFPDNNTRLDEMEKNY